ncbi:hypothetical protein HYX01_03325 [Candidatus Woesearchaeota archaeon]|nr:hypothetical protein [Candidatus Woesearchaeota archaeon]
MAEKRKKREWPNFNTAMVLLLLIAAFTIMRQINKPITPTTNLEKEAEAVLTMVSSEHDGIGLLSSNELSEEKIKAIREFKYEELKNKLELSSDFCIFFEDTTGNLVKIDDMISGIGSDKIYVNGYPCDHLG